MRNVLVAFLCAAICFLSACGGKGAPPVADAGKDQVVIIGDVAQLDGSASSDPKGKAITYKWEVIGSPEGVTVTLTNPETATPTLNPTVEGIYRIELTVDNGKKESDPDEVLISAVEERLNFAPMAEAGLDQSVLPGAVVNLDGSQSVDPEGSALTYTWRILSKPESSAAALSDSSAVKPTFTVDLAGTYIITLIVNDGKTNSLVDTVTVWANGQPIAQAGNDQEGNVGDLIVLDGSASSDPDGGALVYSWTLSSFPSGSTAEAYSGPSGQGLLIPDKGGTYIVELEVSDENNLSDSDEANIVVNELPVSHAGADQSVTVGNTVNLDGSGSYDPDLGTITFTWGFISMPSGSAASLADSHATSTSFTPDKGGEYLLDRKSVV